MNEKRSFNRAAVLEFLQNDEELLSDMIDLFREHAPKQLDDLKEAVKAGDAIAIEKAAHKLKGSIATFDQSRVKEIARDIENRARKGSAEIAAEDVTELEEQIRSMIGEMEK